MWETSNEASYIQPTQIAETILLMAPRGLVTATLTRETPAAESGPTPCTPVALQSLSVAHASVRVDKKLATDESRHENYSGEFSGDAVGGKGRFGESPCVLRINARGGMSSATFDYSSMAYTGGPLRRL